MIRIGLGQDSHRFESQFKKPLIFGGVKICDEGGMHTNSDGDVVLHSLCNALSSAIGGDSMGTWTNDMCHDQKITDSRQYVKVVMEKIKTRGYQVVNTAIAVEAQTPRLSPLQITKVKQSIASLLLIKASEVGLTFTSGEDITPFGLGEAIQVFATVLIEKH